MIYPSADTIEHQMSSKYSMVIIAAKRAKQIKEGAPILIDTDSTNTLTIAMEEIAAGKVTISQASMMPPETVAPNTAPAHGPLLTETDATPGAAALETDAPETVAA
ncbi:MAG: DNA-directed RNA polymerase subunit omega [Armatimonadota bacterium]|nr:DNA-directed RNA polymerase subunit omega [Armatimonadota bacterium]